MKVWQGIYLVIWLGKLRNKKSNYKNKDKYGNERKGKDKNERKKMRIRRTKLKWVQEYKQTKLQLTNNVRKGRHKIRH